MQELTQIYKSRGKEFIDDLLTDYVVVTEKISGSSFSFCKRDGGLVFFKGNGQRPINLVDRTLMMYYESPIRYIKNATAAILPNVPDNWTFCFQYFVHNEPGVIRYDRLPKNNLILTHILIKNDSGKVAKIIDDPRVIRDWSVTLNVTPLQPIFSGYLTKEQKTKIKEFISLPIEDQEELFGTSSFASYLVNLLGTSIRSTALQNDLYKPIDSIIFKFYKSGTKETFSAKLIDPYTKTLMKNKELEDIRRSPADINEIILLDILAFLEERGLRKHEVLTSTPEERYIELVSAIFNDYVQKRGNDVKNLNFEKADFVKAREFNLNTDLIHNKKTKELVEGSESLSDLYKVMLGSLKKKRNPQKAGAVLTPTVIADFNAMIDKISNVVNTDTTNGEFKTFNDYLNLKSTNESIFVQSDIEDLIKEDVYLGFKEFTVLDKVNINEELKQVNIGKETVGYVDSNDEYSINTIKRIASSSDGKDQVKAILLTKGIPADRQDELINILASSNWNTSSSYVLDPKITISDLLGKKLDSFAINKKYLGFNDKLSSDQFFTYQWPTQPPMGKGEVWLSLIIKGGSKAGVGDVDVDGMNLEVKGKGARLVGQHGFGDAKQMKTHIRNAIIEVCSNLGIDYTPPEGNGLEWSVTKKEGRLLEKSLMDMAKLKGGFSKKDIEIISAALIESYKNLFINLITPSYRNILTSVISKDGKIDIKKYNIEMIKMSFDYYHQSEQFIYFGLTNPKNGQFLIIEPKDFGYFIEKDIIVYTPPSWSDRAGTQGGYYSVELK